MPPPDLATVKDAAIRNIRTLAPQIVPGGRINGQWYVARVPWRDDGKPSLYVSLTTGQYKDFARAESGTVIDLVMRADGCSLLEARDRLAVLLGIADGPRVRRVRRVRPKCADCRHAWQRTPAARYCLLLVDSVREEPWPTRSVRRSGWACGPDGKLWEKKSVLGSKHTQCMNV